MPNPSTSGGEMQLFQQKLNELAEQNLLRRIRSVPDCRLNCSSNDYLGLSLDYSLQAEFLQSFSDRPLPLFGSTSSRLLCGDSEYHQSLENILAAAYQRAALLLNSGYHANIGILPALADPHTLILADKLVHASLIDGIRLAGCDYRRFRHNDMMQLARLLAEHSAHYRRIIIVSESIFSMDGDFAPLAELVALKQQYGNVWLYLDEAHAIGVYGATGLGLAEQQNLLPHIDFLVGTFGKAAASIGAYLICDEVIKDYLINTMRPLIFSTALPPLNIAWSEFIFRRLPQWQNKRRHLAGISQQLRQAISAKGLPMPSQSHVIPYITGSNASAEQLAAQLQAKGCYALPIRPPTVPANTARLRFSLTAAMTDEEIDWLISLL